MTADAIALTRHLARRWSIRFALAAAAVGVLEGYWLLWMPVSLPPAEATQRAVLGMAMTAASGVVGLVLAVSLARRRP